MINIEYVTKEVSAFYNVSIKQLKSKSRKREIVFPRQIAMAICKNVYPNVSLKLIGNYFGGRDHSTVIHACMVISDLCSYDKKIKAEYDTILAHVKSKSTINMPLDIKQMLLGICPIKWSVNGKVIINKYDI